MINYNDPTDFEAKDDALILAKPVENLKLLALEDPTDIEDDKEEDEFDGVGLA